ncbi:MAG: YhdP family protein [Gammaproteobacteria bacterium]|nr:YhdP family protein [Gammaproteobacteria bacterium]MDH3768195.1 YhdP family protein [Gammaproteobacteria bacterium]
MLRTLWKWLAASFSVIVILLAIGIGLFRLLLPLVPQYHERIEAFASEAAGTPVRIEGIDARWGFAGPELRFRNAQLLTTDGNNALLSADTGSVIVDLGALLRKRELRAGQILLGGLKLDVIRDADGAWQVGGLQEGSGSRPERLAIGLRQAQVIFRDEASNVGPWVFDDVDINVELQNRHFRIDGVMQLPPELGGEIEASLEANGDLDSPDTLQWQAYVHGADIALAGWVGLLPQDKTTPVGGNGNVTGWLAMDGGKLQQANVQLDLQDVVLARSRETMRLLDVVKGRIEFDRIDAGWQVSGRDITLLSDGEAWPAATFGIEQVGGAGEDGLLYADFDYLRLQDVAPLTDWVPHEKIRSLLGQLKPRGVVEDLSFRLTRDQGEVDSYSLRTRFSDLGINATDKLPGFDTVRGDLRMDAHGGRLQLDPSKVVIDLPDIMGKPVTAERVNGVIVWRQYAGGLRIVSDNVDIDHANFHSSTSAEITLPDEGAPSLDLHTDLIDIDIAGLPDLIPEPILKPDLINWLRQALVGGTVPTATIDWVGDVDKFPFDDGSGEFRVEADLQDTQLAYAKNWPVAREMSGTLTFRNSALVAGISGAELSGNRVSSASVSIADLRKSVLKLSISADGMLDKLHGFLKATPVVEGEDDPFAQVDLSGVGTTEVHLTLPLKKMIERDVRVTVSTESGEVALHGLKHRLEHVEGTLNFHNGDFFADGVTALALGAPVVIDVAPESLSTDAGPRRASVATARGQISDQELARLHQSLATAMAGSAAYTATVTFPEKAAATPVSVKVVTDLAGMALTLPEPLDKPAATPRDFELTLSLPKGSVQTDAILSGVANARINWLRDGDTPWVLDRGGIHFGARPANLPQERGLVLSGAPQRLHAGGWIALDHGEDSGEGSHLAAARLEVGQLDVYGQVLDDAVLTIDRSEREWLVQIDSPKASGALFVPLAGAGPIIANMERMYVDTDSRVGTGDGVAAVTGDETELDPRLVPEMDIQADDFRLGQMKLGQVRARLRKTTNGIGLEQFTSTANAFNVAGQGAWTFDEDGHHTQMEFKLISTDVQPTLLALDFDGSIVASEAEVDFALTWPGPPGPEFKQHLDGAVKVRVGTGQLQTVEPGAGRVFGLFSFTALPRRLSLDFRDVFETGFGFDYIQGDFALDDGNAFTSNLILEGPAAQVGIAGRAGLVERDYDQTAVVYGNFGAALPVAGVLAGGPVGGAAMLIFSELFKKPLQDMARVNYRITGSWDEPAVERVLAQVAGEGAS